MSTIFGLLVCSEVSKALQDKQQLLQLQVQFLHCCLWKVERLYMQKEQEGKLIARNYQRKKKVHLKLNIKPMSKRNWEEAKPWLLGRPVGTLHQK
jgi:hypothetical protein